MSGTSIWDNPALRAEDYATQVERREHDRRCEQRERSYICHCDKRKRLASGLTELPTDELYFPPPDCPVCDKGLQHDGDGWDCPTCHLAWNSSGNPASCRFTDDFGSDFGGERFGRLMRHVILQDVTP